VSSGVPQGSILGPLLFILYVNDIDDVLSTSAIYKFADDTKILSAISTRDDANAFQRDISALEAWSKKWKMPFNTGKSSLVHFGNRCERYTYTMNGQMIDPTEVERDLGVWIDGKLNFEAHIKNIVAKARKLCGRYSEYTLHATSTCYSNCLRQ
jgi:ribonucleases P/MRP protein subunit RPP40